MTEDDTGGSGERSRDGPDPSFIKRLEDDSLWARGDDSRGEGRVDRERSRSSRVAAGEQRRLEHRKARRLRRMAVAILVVAAVAITITGLEVKDSEFGAPSIGRSAPFSLLPLERSSSTVTTESTTTSSTTNSSTTTSTTTTTTPVAAVVFR